MAHDFETIVVGAGLFGSAATRYLSQHSRRPESIEGADIGVIGSAEPTDWSQHDGVFASHYDQGRITRRLSKNRLWAELAQRAIAQYATLETQSGIKFHVPTGGLYVAPRGKADNYAQNVAEIAQKYAIPYTTSLSPFPFLHFPQPHHVIHEAAPAGYINPRDLIRAQLTIAHHNGAALICETVTAVRPNANGVTVFTREGGWFSAEKVLLATGAFTNCFDLVSRPLALRIKSETILLAHISEQEASRLAQMPTVIYMIESPIIDSIYLLPPIRYPDGNIYLKLGCNTVADQWLDGLEAMRDWMIHGDSDVVADTILTALYAIIPNLKTLSTHTKRCLVTYTPHGNPFIGQVRDGVFVVTAGNGSGAKSSDAIGRLAADLVRTGAWQSDLDEQAFAVRWM